MRDNVAWTADALVVNTVKLRHKFSAFSIAVQDNGESGIMNDGMTSRGEVVRKIF